jgi:hypothetical protein
MIRIPPSLKHRRFFYLWLGQLLSIAGTQMQIWALFWHIRELTEKPMLWAALAWRELFRSYFFP